MTLRFGTSVVVQPLSLRDAGLWPSLHLTELFVSV